MERIVITGGPGTGKTVVVQALEDRGYKCYHEVIREMTADAKKQDPKKEKRSNPLAFVEDPMAFNRRLIEGRTLQYEQAMELGEPICFFDRGIPDVLAYMDYFDQAYPEVFEKVAREKRYDKVFVLPPWAEIYVSDNERMETFEQAKELHAALIRTYAHLGYSPILVPKAPVGDRTQFILENL